MVEGKCSWDMMIAAQHPNMPKAHNWPWPQGKTLKTRPYNSLRDYSKGEAWFAKKKAAAKKVFEDVSAEADFEYCPEKLRKVFEALPYNMTFTVGFDALGIFPNDDRHCACPFSRKCAKWRKLFDLEEIFDEYSSDICGKGKTATSRFLTPSGLMQHLQTFQKHWNLPTPGLHHYVALYLRELYGPPFCGKVGHKGLYHPSSSESIEAAAYEVNQNHL